jgi:pSer/pThr/pTyr-binding forkhead associated (FHA) protein
MPNEATHILSAPNLSGTVPASAMSSPETCPHCQATIASGEEFCPQCGYQRGSWQLGAAAPTGGAHAAAGAATGAPARYLLVASDGREFSLPDGETIAGRGDVPLQIADGFISRQHARFHVTADGVSVTDLGSSNGTFVAGSRLDPDSTQPLPEGVQLSLGQLELTLRSNPAFGDATLAVPSSAHSAEDSAAPADETAADTAASATEDEETGTAADSGWSLSAADGTVHTLAPGTTQCGRKPDGNALVIPDGYISGRHCVFQASAQALTVTDLGSTNGTFVNGEQLAANELRELQAGDSLRLGQLELQVRRALELPEPGPEDMTLGSTVTLGQ